MAARARASRVELTMTDDGPGIPATLLAHVFDRFTRTTDSKSAPGAGLGLSICQGLIEAMDGTIAAESPVADGHGTRITMTLPAGPRPSDASEPAR
jgi:two-component system sensor histidine kinase KdpD